jgi:hypothetical protein
VRKLEPLHPKAWMLPLIVAAVAVPIVAAFMFGGPGAGLAAGALAAGVILVVAAAATFEEPIEVASSPAGRYLLLVVLTVTLDDPGQVGALAEIAAAGASAARVEAADILLLAPAINKPVAHWLSDLGAARFDAQRRLAISLGSLAAAHLDGRGEVGDSDLVQAVEDTLRTVPAQEVVFVAGPGYERQIDRVRRRLDRPVRVLSADSAPQPSA